MLLPLLLLALRAPLPVLLLLLLRPLRQLPSRLCGVFGGSMTITSMPAAALGRSGSS